MAASGGHANVPPLLAQHLIRNPEAAMAIINRARQQQQQQQIQPQDPNQRTGQGSQQPLLQGQPANMVAANPQLSHQLNMLRQQQQSMASSPQQQQPQPQPQSTFVDRQQQEGPAVAKQNDTPMNINAINGLSEAERNQIVAALRNNPKFASMPAAQKQMYFARIQAQQMANLQQRQSPRPTQQQQQQQVQAAQGQLQPGLPQAARGQAALPGDLKTMTPEQISQFALAAQQEGFNASRLIQQQQQQQQSAALGNGLQQRPLTPLPQFPKNSNGLPGSPHLNPSHLTQSRTPPQDQQQLRSNPQGRQQAGALNPGAIPQTALMNTLMEHFKNGQLSEADRGKVRELFAMHQQQLLFQQYQQAQMQTNGQRPTSTATAQSQGLGFNQIQEMMSTANGGVPAIPSNQELSNVPQVTAQMINQPFGQGSIQHPQQMTMAGNGIGAVAGRPVGSSTVDMNAPRFEQLPVQIVQALNKDQQVPLSLPPAQELGLQQVQKTAFAQTVMPAQARQPVSQQTGPDPGSKSVPPIIPGQPRPPLDQTTFAKSKSICSSATAMLAANRPPTKLLENLSPVEKTRTRAKIEEMKPIFKGVDGMLPFFLALFGQFEMTKMLIYMVSCSIVAVGSSLTTLQNLLFKHQCDLVEKDQFILDLGELEKIQHHMTRALMYVRSNASALVNFPEDLAAMEPLDDLLKLDGKTARKNVEVTVTTEAATSDSPKIKNTFRPEDLKLPPTKIRKKEAGSAKPGSASARTSKHDQGALPAAGSLAAVSTGEMVNPPVATGPPSKHTGPLPGGEVPENVATSLQPSSLLVDDVSSKIAADPLQYVTKLWSDMQAEGVGETHMAIDTPTPRPFLDLIFSPASSCPTLQSLIGDTPDSDDKTSKTPSEGPEASIMPLKPYAWEDQFIELY